MSQVGVCGWAVFILVRVTAYQSTSQTHVLRRRARRNCRSENDVRQRGNAQADMAEALPVSHLSPFAI